MTRGDDLVFSSATRQAALIRARELSPVELVQAYLERIDRIDGRLRAYIAVRPEQALAAARAAEAAVMRGEPVGPLHGIPFAVKDQFDVRGLRTTMGSRVLGDAVAGDDATVVSRLTAAGGILLGKLNMTEFALGGTVDFPFGQPRNPWNVDHDPGGSSSGSGIAVAAALCAIALGEDTGGSVRSPAGFCGAVGLRPTWGRVSRHGCFPLSPSLDIAGPLSRSVEDTAVIVQVIAGWDPRDPTTSRREVPDYPGLLGGPVRGSGRESRGGAGELGGMTVGVIRELTFGADVDPEVREAMVRASAQLEKLGARVEEVSLPLLPLAGAVFMALADSEGAGLHLGWLRSRSGDYDQGTRRRLVTAALLPAAVVHQAERARALIRGQVQAALARHDVLLCPTSPRPAATIAQGKAPITSKAEVAGRFFTRRSYTTPASLAGVPALAVPCGFSTAGLPLSLQLIGRRFDEVTVLRTGYAYEHATDWHRRRPPL